MAVFQVLGPYEVPAEGKIVTGEKIRKSWTGEWSSLATRKGCYIFAMRVGKGYIPIYVGKATKTFKQECFTDNKLVKIMRALARHRIGTLVIFFVCLPNGRGAVNRRQIDEVEKFLIGLGYKKNEDLENDRNIAIPSWEIRGVVRGGRGKPSKAAQAFKKVFDLN